MGKNLYRRLFLILLVPMLFVLSGCDDFEKTFSFNSNSGQIAESVIEAADGSYVIAGQTYNTSLSKPVLLKLNPEGEKLLEIVYPYKGTFNSIKAANGGGYVIAGATGEYQDYAGSILKTDESGNQVWAFSYGYTLYDVEVLDDGYLVVGGSSFNGKLYIAKLTLSGEVVWELTDETNGEGTDVAVLSDGNFMVVTKTASIVEFDPNGVIVWSQSHAVGNISARTFRSIAATSDGGFILGGQLEEGQDYDVWVIRLNADREIVWEKTYTGTKVVSVGIDGLNSIVQTTDGGFVFCGFQAQIGANIFNGGSLYGWVMKIDQNGTEEWSKTRGADNKKNEALKSIIQTSDGRLLSVGSTRSFAQEEDLEWWVLRFDEGSN